VCVVRWLCVVFVCRCGGGRRRQSKCVCRSSSIVVWRCARICVCARISQRLVNCLHNCV
jgi:hypothetical protein